MSKYIIEPDEDAKAIQSINITSLGNVYTESWYVENLEQLNSDYINEHFGELQDDAYQRGIDDAWKLAEDVLYNRGNVLDILRCATVGAAFDKYSAGQALDILKAYKEKQKAADDIKIGDEVAFHHDDGRPDTVVVVTYIGKDGFIDGMDGRGTQYAHKNPTKWTKTGRHFDIESILKEIRA